MPLAKFFVGNKSSRRNLAIVAVIFGLAGSIIIGWSHAASNNFTNVLNNPINPSNLTNIPFGAHSDWIQPWRAYMETVPSSVFTDAVGVNFNVFDNSVEPTARMLAANGFTRARIEVGWNNIDYDNPTQMTPSAQQKLQQKIAIFKKYGIRPLILLNANSGGPGPAKAFTTPVTVTQAAPAGATTIKINPSIIPQIKLNYSGSNFTDSGSIQARYRFTNVTPDGTVTLSYPLKTAVPAGDYKNAVTQKFQPFFPPTKDDGSPSPYFNETMNGWLQYTGAVTKAVKQTYGSDDFDVEIWNELSFGSAFLNASNYYSPMPAGYTAVSGQKSILFGTIDYIRDPANGVPNIKIGNGFSSQAPWGNGNNQPVGETAMDKHPYAGLLRRPSQGQAGTPIDALGQKDPLAVRDCRLEYNLTAKAAYTDTNKNGKFDINEPCTGKAGLFSPFEPKYNLFLPEAFLNGVTTETIIRDLAPFPNVIQSDKNCTASVPLSFNDRCVNIHGRGTKPCPTCAPLELWVTEVNLPPADGTVYDPANPSVKTLAAMTSAEKRHIASKNFLRYLTAWINKGVTALDFYAVSGEGFAVVDQSYFDQLNAADIKHNPSFYPGNNSGGPSVSAIKNLTDIMKQGSAPLGQSRQLTLDRIADNHNHIQFKGNGTPQYPDLYNRDVLAVLPFQVNDHRFAIPSYVMTRNTAWVYNNNAPTDGARFDMPPEAYQITLSGFDATKDITASAVDPLTNAATPVSIASRTGGTIVLQADLTDSPRVIIVDETTPGAPLPDTTPPDTTITVSPAVSTTNTSASFSFTSSEGGSSFECKLDSGSFAACNSPQTYANLAVGSHTFSVQAADASGNRDNTPGTYTWKVAAIPDTTPPNAPTNLKAVAPSSVAVNLDWTASMDSGGSGLDGYNIYRNGTKLNTTPISAISYSDGTVSEKITYSYTVEAVDKAGNKSAQTPPVSVTTPAKPAGKRGDVTGPNNNADGKIDIFDLSYLIRNYNTNNLNADVSGPNNQTDGKVDIFDLSYIIRNYGG